MRTVYPVRSVCTWRCCCIALTRKDLRENPVFVQQTCVMRSLRRSTRRSLKTSRHQGFPDVLPRNPKLATVASPCRFVVQRSLLSIQKFLQKSTGLAGLLKLHPPPIVMFKNIALNFPSSRAGAGRQWVVGTCFSPQQELRRAVALENSERLSSACIQTGKTFLGGICENQLATRPVS